MLSKKSILVLFLAGSLAPLTFAQKPAPNGTASTPTPASPAASSTDKPADGGAPHYLYPESEKQRADRIGTEDPGPDPAPSKIFFRYGKSYHIEKFDRRFAVEKGGDPGWIRPYGFANIYKELYQLNDKFVWAWIEEKDVAAEEAATPAPPSSKYPAESVAYFQSTREEFSPLTPPDSDKTISFVAASDGLPTTGSWRNSLTVADMNGDGFADIIAPPERGGNGVPAIFLGDGKGHWKFWDTVKWPYRVNYGSVVAGDFNKDGKMDLAFAVHLEGIHVFLGDGQGNFTDSSTGLPNDYASRRLLAMDVDHDGSLDLVALSEGPTAMQRDSSGGAYGKLRAFLNTNKGASWVGVNIPVDPKLEFGGDWLSAGNFNGDNYPDFLTASVYYNSPWTLFVSDGAKKWKNGGQQDGKVIPLLAYSFASTTGHFSSKKVDDGVISYVRFWPGQLDASTVPEPPIKQIAGVERITFIGKEPKRIPIMRWEANRGIFGMGRGDFDGDGNVDLIFVRYDPKPEFVLLLGDGKGGFTRAKLDGIKVEPNATYDFQVADVNGDGKPDVIIGYEATGNSRLGIRDGSIHVFLNQGTVSSTTVTAKK